MSPPIRPFRIVPCNEWGALPPRRPIDDAGRFDKALFHHTAGHHPELPPPEPAETFEELVAYARAIQLDHMRRDNNTWRDSGHNFLVGRNGYILEGRHRSLELLLRGHCPTSAHCPGQNDQPGVEIEHAGSESMTASQREAAVWLFALICRKGGFAPERIFGHRDFWATTCPANLYAQLPDFRRDVARALEPPPPRPVDYNTRPWFGRWAIWHLKGRDPDRRPADVPDQVSQGAFRTLERIIELAKETP